MPGDGVRACLSLGALLIGSPAPAQRADQNAVTEAQDAFGTSNGTQSIGLYSVNDARGFNPQQAGNLRLEGLYVNLTSPYLNPCLIRDTTMRIGIAAQSVSFPAPTGVADLRLYTPGAEPRASAVVNTGSFNESGVLLEGQTRLAAQLNGTGCLAYNRNFVPDETRRVANVSVGSTLSWHPATGTDIIPFWGVMTGHERDVIPVVYTDGLAPPPVYRARDLAVQDFTQQKWHVSTGGILAHQVLAPNWSLAAGLFLSRENDPRIDVDQYLSVLPDRHAEHVLDVVPPLSSGVNSGEARLTRRTSEGIHSRTVELSLRGRRADREYGGDALVDYGPVTLESPPDNRQLPFTTTAVSRDSTRQLDTALSYEERWNGVGSFAVGLMRSRYQRTITEPATAPRADTTAPWLASARFSANAGSTLTFYGSYLQGLEDALLAPSTATNRGEPPPATRTHQGDAGLRYAPGPHLSVILGAFEIDKAYFNLDAAALYTRLGELRHRGLESSLAYGADGITAVAGGVWLRPHVERVIAEPGATGTVPIGPTPVTLTMNLDVAPDAWKPFAAQLQLNRRSGGVATADDRVRLAPVTVLAIGGRYEAKFHDHALSVRLDLQNLTNAAGIRLTAVDQLLPEPRRRYSLLLAMDY